MNLQEGATTMECNHQIGGHKTWNTFQYYIKGDFLRYKTMISDTRISLNRSVPFLSGSRLWRMRTVQNSSVLLPPWRATKRPSSQNQKRYTPWIELTEYAKSLLDCKPHILNQWLEDRQKPIVTTHYFVPKLKSATGKITDEYKNGTVQEGPLTGTSE